MKVSLHSALFAIVAVGCSSPSDVEPGGGTFAGGQTSLGGQTSVGGQIFAGGRPSFGGQTFAGGQPSVGGQNHVGAGGVTSGGTAGVPNWGGGSPGGALANGGAAQVGGSVGSGGNTSGGAAPMDAGTDASPGTYTPCPRDGSACKILPLGDSITFGVGDEGNAGYRGPLFALAVAAQQKITFTGSLSNGPDIVSGQPFPKRNEGHSGWGISTVTQYSGGVAGIATLIPSPAFADSSGGLPNIILMMIGTNDTGNSTASAMSDRLAALMDKIIAAAPDALMVVAKITPLAWANNIINPYNDSMVGLVQTRAASGKHVMLADMNTGFTSAMTSSDGIHPNSSGYEFMANRWYAGIGSLLPR